SAIAGYTSGGEQQMCAIGRALMSRPKMILLDEPSMGLAPQIVEEIFEIIGNLNIAEAVSFLLAEQNTRMALRYARYGYILENGRVVLDGEAKSLAENEDVKEFYLGTAEGKRKSCRDVNHYRRRQGWVPCAGLRKFDPHAAVRARRNSHPLLIHDLPSVITAGDAAERGAEGFGIDGGGEILGGAAPTTDGSPTQ